MSITTNTFLKIATLSAATALSTFSIASAATIDGLVEDNSIPGSTTTSKITFTVTNGQDGDEIYTADKVNDRTGDFSTLTGDAVGKTDLVSAINTKADASAVYTTAQSDTNLSNSIALAKTYVDNTFATKSEIANLTTNNFATKAQVTDLSNRVNKAIAMAAALDFVAPSDNKHLNVIVGSAGYKNQQAVSAGLTLRFNNVLFGVGGSFSGSESLVKGVVSISAF